MKLKKVILEIASSGLIPLGVGAAMILFESSRAAPSLAWGLLGLGWVFVGLFLGNDYINKTEES